ncbi:MAG: ARMT1-like domain-containing protein [Alphaproteobacteria bacterium]|nr:ARMT1-like domain-containing protein [Alphaproteobacteria bacterium]
MTKKSKASSLAGRIERLLDKNELNCLTEIDRDLGRTLHIQDTSSFISEIMTSLIPSASKQKLDLLFDTDFEIGTFFLSERIKRPDFISAADNLQFREWVNTNVSNELLRLKKSNPESYYLLHRREIEKNISVNDFVFLSLFLMDRTKNKRLVEQVPNQIYQDIFTKLISFFMFGDVNKYPYVEKDYNEKVEAVSLKILEKIQKVSIYDLFRYSIAAGSLGVDMKSSASAASPIRQGIKNIIFYETNKLEKFVEKVERMKQELDRKVEENLAIDFWKEFEHDFINSQEKKTLVWFHDDVAETIFDLFFIQKVLSANNNLKIVSIPRSGRFGTRFGNDASSLDIERYLDMSIFSDLRQAWEKEQYSYSDAGPCWGAVHGMQLSEETVDLILCSSAILVKGSRSYEMLQGIKVDAYFASMVCRDFSESIFDLDAEEGSSLFLKQEAGLLSFQGFRKRHKRKRMLSNGRTIMLTSMTAREYAKAICHQNYRDIVSKFPDKLEANLWIKNETKRRQKTIADFILDYKNNKYGEAA